MTKRELPFDCRVIDTKPVEVANRFTGEKITIPADAVAVYDSIMGAELFNDYATMRKGLDWFITNEPDAYMVLLDWTAEEYGIFNSSNYACNNFYRCSLYTHRLQRR